MLQLIKDSNISKNVLIENVKSKLHFILIFLFYLISYYWCYIRFFLTFLFMLYVKSNLTSLFLIVKKLYSFYGNYFTKEVNCIEMYRLKLVNNLTSIH